MKVTTDTYTGKSFRWNDTVLYCGYVVPVRTTERASTHLHPSRVPEKLLRELNNGRGYALP